MGETETSGVQASWNKSESIAQLATALAIVQGRVTSAIKGKVNPYFNSNYADLASCWDACREHLSSNGLAVIQLPSAQGSSVVIKTILAHSSGEWVSSELTMTAEKATPQSIGSAITYGRRYGLCAIVGIAPDDDDGNAAEGLSAKNGKAKRGRAGEHQSDQCDQCFEEGVPAGETVIHQKNGHTYLNSEGDDHMGKYCPVCKKLAAQADALAKGKRPASSTPLDFKEWMLSMKTAKEKLGDKLYYRILVANGYEHANEVKKQADQKRIHDEMAELYKSVQVMKPAATVSPASPELDDKTFRKRVNDYQDRSWKKAGDVINKVIGTKPFDALIGEERAVLLAELKSAFGDGS